MLASLRLLLGEIWLLVAIGLKRCQTVLELS